MSQKLTEGLSYNPYAHDADKHITWAHDWQGETGDTEETQAANVGLAQAYATLALAFEVRRQADKTAGQDFFAQPGAFHHDDGGHLQGSSIGMDPATLNPATAEDDLEHAIEVLAADLWEADPRKQTPARTFGEDYANAQDRYRTMARAILAPEPVEPAAKR